MLLTDGSGTVSWGAQPVAGLPSQTSNSGKLLTTNGTSASWSNAVTVSGNNATVTGTLTVNGVATAGSYLTSAAGLAFPGALSASGYYLYSGSANGLTMYGYGSTYDVYIGNRAGTRALSVAANSTVVSIPDTTASTTTSTGALVVGNGTSGGLGVGGNIYAGGDIITTKSNGVIKASGSSANAEVAAERLTLTPSSVSMVAAVSQPQLAFTSDTAGSYTWGRILANSSEIVRVHSANLAAIANVAGAGIAVAGGITSTGNTTISATTASTSTSSGALVVSGGVGVAGAIFAGGNIQSNAVFAANNTTLYLRPSGASVSSGQVIIETSGNITASGDLQFTANNTYDVGSSTNRIRAVHVRDLFVGTATPASASATGTAGQITWDASYIYVCTATNTWKRVAISTW
jgi:hypothetical protein